MDGFLGAIPAAAASPLALTAYAIAALIFLFAGARLRTTQALLKKIDALPENERRRGLEVAAGEVIPTHISPEQWIRSNKMKWTFLLLAGVLVAIVTVSVIAIANPAQAQLKDLQEGITRSTDSTVSAAETTLASKIDSSASRVITAVENAALANLETMFPLAVRITRNVDGTIMYLRGQRQIRIVSYDDDLKPMKVYWGDRFHYYVYSETGDRLDTTARVDLEIRPRNRAPTIHPLEMTRGEHELRIPGSTPDPMEAYLVNHDGASGIAIKITIYSEDRERGREQFREALLNTALGPAARRVYQEVTADGARLRNQPGESSTILRPLSRGTYLRVKDERGDWCNVRLPEGREGWIFCRFIAPIK
jgi:uncharacterized protein (UPF0333 family)